MRVEVVSEQQGISLIVLFIVGSAVVLGVGAEAAGDVWIAVLLAVLVSFPVLAIYARLHQLLPMKDLFDIALYALGPGLGRLVCLAYIWFAFHLGAIVLRNFGEFIVTVGLVETPQLLPLGLFIIICIWAVKEGLEVLGRWSNLFARLTIPMIVVTIALLSTEMDLNNFIPILYNGWSPVVSGAYQVFSFPFAETVIFLLVFSSFQNNTSPYRIYLYGLLVGGIVIFLAASNEMAVLGSDLYRSSYFPAYQAVARLNIRDFLQRVEIIAALSFVIGGFVKISVCLLASSRGIAKLCGFDDYRFLVTPVAFLMVTTALLLYDSIMEMQQWAVNVWPLYALPFQIVLPLFIWIICEIRRLVDAGS